jgi:hypothetical protein
MVGGRDMFRDRIFEWNRVFNLMIDSWTHAKIFAEPPRFASTASANAATTNNGSYRAEMAKTASRAHTAPAQFNRWKAVPVFLSTYLQFQLDPAMLIFQFRSGLSLNLLDTFGLN